MNKSRLEWKVGLFILVSLVCAAALIMKFSKSTSVFTRTYQLLLITSNVGGIRVGATVLMAGVQVGTVGSVELDDSGKLVIIHVQIQSRIHIRQDARFTIEQAGFLGDQYISITPGANTLPQLQPGDKVNCEEPFNLQEVARSGAGLVRRLDQTATKLNEAVGRLDQTLLSEQTLTNVTVAIANFRTLSERAMDTLHGVDGLVETNSSPLNTAISNLVHFSEQLDQFAAELQSTVATNRADVTATIKNVQAGTVQLNGLLGDLQAGKGMLGSVLKDELLQRQFSSAVSNLNIVSSNLSQHGLLWKPRPKRATTTNSVYSGKLPSR